MSGPPVLCRCVIDTKPRTLDTEQMALLCNFAEMAVREMEKDKLCSLQRGNSLTDEMTADGMHRAVKALTEGLFVVDVMSPGWKILLMNEQAAEFAGWLLCLPSTVGKYEFIRILTTRMHLPLLIVSIDHFILF